MTTLPEVAFRSTHERCNLKEHDRLDFFARDRRCETVHLLQCVLGGDH